MSKSVLMSIKPRYCELIASGKKTVELRKTFPKLKPPFKCYIYETMTARFSTDIMDKQYFHGFDGRGKVIGEFVCDGIRWMGGSFWAVKDDIEEALQGSCVSYEELKAYLRVVPGSSVYDKKREFYRWHISNLKIYDKPKELSDFMQCHKCEYYSGCKEHEYGCDGIYKVKRPPMSWCYVEEIL